VLQNNIVVCSNGENLGTKNKIEIIQKEIIHWEKSNFQEYPWRLTTNKFHALIAELMLQRTNADQVVPVYEKFTAAYPNLDSAVEAVDSNMKILLRPLGLNWRIENILNLISQLGYLNDIPQKYDELISLSGVGDYVASAFLIFQYNVSRPLIDSNAIRLWCRIFNLDLHGEMRRKRDFIALVDSVTPKNNCKLFSYGVLDISRKYCKSRPFCGECPLNILCITSRKNK